MKREEAKQLLPVIQAYAEGKEMQLKNDGVWQDAKYQIPFDNITPEEIRIKPKPTYRSFNSQEECWAEMQKHQPFGWLKSKYDGSLFFIDSIEKYKGSHGSSSFLFEEPFLQATFADGTPFGIKVEED